MKCLFALVITTSSAFTVIPTRLHENGYPLIEAMLGDGETKIYDLSIGAFSRSFVSFIEFPATITFNITRPDSGNISLTTTRHALTLSEDADQQGWIAIGPGSDLARTFGSVDFTGSEIVLGSFEDFFLTDQCHGAFVEIPTRMEMVGGYANSPRVFSTISFKLLDVRTTTLVVYEPIETVFHGPAAYFKSIFETIATASKVASESAFFEDCDRIRKLLPSIHFVYFGDSLTTEHEITSLQYTRKLTGNVCELLISSDTTTDTALILFNPMRIPGVKIRAGMDKIVLCI